MEKEIRHVWQFNQPPQEVWNYLTKPELMEQWLGKSDIQPIPGHRFRLTGTQGSKISCEVLEAKPFTRLSYSWQKVSAKDNTMYDSKVVWTLIPTEKGTELHLLHNGFIAVEDYTAHNNGWTVLVDRLVETLNTVRI